MEKTQQYLAKTYDEKVKNIVLLSTIILFVLIFSFLFLLRKVIVKPITTFRDTAKIIGKGKLDTKINISSRDELGELADAFNQMTKDLKESRDKIQDYTQILENLLDRKDEFIGQLGHDLKNPLQPLIGLLPVLIEKEKDPETKEALQIMNKNAEYMRDLIFETLQLAKLRSADVKFDFEDVKLREEAEGCVDSQKLLLKEHKITVDNKIADNITVYADKLRLVEVFKNLISNAVKYMQEGGGKITLDAKQEGDIVTVSIQDTGIGMTQEQLKKMFDEFYKADRFSSEYQSTGLGLAICKRIIEKHDGKIWVDSLGLGKGTTFYFTLKNKTKNN
jgi:signal transduction histidine kinase